MADGVLPSFEKPNYDAQGGEMKSKMPGVKGGDADAPAEVAEQSFIQKYWWHMLIGFLVLQTLGGGGGGEEGPAQGGAAAAKK